MFGIGTVRTPIVPCTEGRFNTAIDSKVTEETCAMIKKLVDTQNSTTDESKQKWCKQRIGELKKQLPVITPMATFRGDKRASANAIPSGLNMLDVDHIAEPKELWEKIKDKVPYEVRMAHVTPSTQGLRIVFVQPSGVSIEEAQAKVAKALKVEYDGVTKDLARCSFLVPRSYFLYIAPNLFEDVTIEDVEKEAEGVKEEAKTEEQKSREYPTDFQGVPYADIIGVLLMSAGYDETPCEGERNNALYMLARNLRYICDFNTEFILSVVPDWQLPRHEMETTITSAVKSVRMASMPKYLRKTVDDLKRQNERQIGDTENENLQYQVSEEGFIGEIIKYQQPICKNASYFVIMACMGTLLTKLRGHGCDGSVLAPNFMVTISAPQATGKSFMKRLMHLVCAPIRQEDKVQRAKLREIDKENRKNKDKDDYEEKEFEGAIRLLPSNTSNRILLERLDLAKGQHCMIMAEEIDSMTKSEKSGKWSEKSDIYRLAYDNSEWGQDYASENSYKAVVEVFLNLLFSGTPAAVGRFFNDIENGLVTRFIFSSLPDTYGQKRPKIVNMPTDTQALIADKLQRLYNQMQSIKTEDGFIWLDTTKMVEDALAYYDEPQRIAYLNDQEHPSRDLARRRYADYCVKFMMIETWLNDGVYTEAIRDRAVAMTALAHEQLILTYGDDLDKSLTESLEASQPTNIYMKKQDLLKSVKNDTFTVSDFVDTMRELGMSASKQSANTYLKRMMNGGLVKRVERGVYEKI